MATAPRATNKGVNPGGRIARVPRHKTAPRKPTPRNPQVQPGGPMINTAGHAPRTNPAPRGGKKKTTAKRKTAKRGAALYDAVQCCGAEALAASLRLAGWVVSDMDVLALHRLASRDAEEAYIEDVLEAAATHGLAGHRLTAYYQELVDVEPCGTPLILGIDQPGPHAVLDDGTAWWSWGQPWEPFPGAVISEAWSITWSPL